MGSVDIVFKRHEGCGRSPSHVLCANVPVRELKSVQQGRALDEIRSSLGPDARYVYSMALKGGGVAEALFWVEFHTAEAAVQALKVWGSRSCRPDDLWSRWRRSQKKLFAIRLRYPNCPCASAQLRKAARELRSKAEPHPHATDPPKTPERAETGHHIPSLFDVDSFLRQTQQQQHPPTSQSQPAPATYATTSTESVHQCLTVSTEQSPPPSLHRFVFFGASVVHRPGLYIKGASFAWEKENTGLVVDFSLGEVKPVIGGGGDWAGGPAVTGEGPTGTGLGHAQGSIILFENGWVELAPTFNLAAFNTAWETENGEGYLRIHLQLRKAY